MKFNKQASPSQRFSDSYDKQTKWVLVIVFECFLLLVVDIDSLKKKMAWNLLILNVVPLRNYHPHD